MPGFSQIRIVFGVNVHNPPPLAGQQGQQRQRGLLRNTVMLDTTQLDRSSEAEWTSFLTFAAKALGLRICLSSFTGMPPDERCDFVYLTDSAALSRKLLLNVPLLYIQPSSRPQYIDTFFYSRIREDGDAHQGLPCTLQPVHHRVTLISSVFEGDEFLKGFLANCASLQGYEHYEHLLIRPGSPGNEHERLIDHVRQCPSALYINLAEDPRLYEVWNLGVKLATSRYISNANIDDRRAPRHVAHLERILNTHPHVHAASTALRVTKEKNLTWEDSGGSEVWFSHLGDLCVGAEGLFQERDNGLVSRNILHCMPLWRRSLHASRGGFDEEKYGPSADWAFWVQAGMEGAQFYFSSHPLGLYLRNEHSYWRCSSRSKKGDQRIVTEFMAWVKNSQKPESRYSSVAEELSAASDLLRNGAVYEGLSTLFGIGLQYGLREDNHLEEAERAHLDTLSRQYLGVEAEHFSELCISYKNAVVKEKDCGSALFITLQYLVHRYKGMLNEEAQRSIELAYADLCECEGKVNKRGNTGSISSMGSMGTIPKANALYWAADYTQALHCYRNAFEATPKAWWYAMEAIRCMRALMPSASAHKNCILYTPDYVGNPYQRNLYSQSKNFEYTILSSKYLELDEELVKATFSQRLILHQHWLKEIYWQASTKESGVRAIEKHCSILKALKAYGATVIWTLHNLKDHDTTPLQEELSDFALRRMTEVSDRIFVHSLGACELLSSFCGQDLSQKCDLVEHPLYDDVLDPGQSHIPEELEHIKPETQRILLFAGRIRPYKGVPDLLCAFQQIVQEIPDHNLHLVIAGQLYDPMVEESLRNMTDKARRSISLLPRRLKADEMAGLMRLAHVSITPYRKILTSGTYFLATTFATPVLAPAVGMFAETIQDGENGFLYDGSIDDLVRSLRHITSLSDKVLATIGEHAYAAAKHLSITEVSSRFFTLVEAEADSHHHQRRQK